MATMKTATPLLVSIPEAAFQLSLSKEDVLSLIADGEITSVAVRGQVLIPYESLKLIARQTTRESPVNHRKRGCGTAETRDETPKLPRPSRYIRSRSPEQRR